MAAYTSPTHEHSAKPLPPISREKLVAHLKNTIVPAKGANSDMLYIWITARNAYVEVLLGKVFCGELDEV